MPAKMDASAGRADGMNRAELKQLVRERLREARVLLRARCWSGAYYLAGYAVECALKTCIIKRLMTIDEFPERRFSEDCYTHRLPQLLGLSGLQGAFDAACAADPDLLARWGTVRDWRETSRYARTPKDKAERLYAAITDKKNGVLTWIKRYW
jgi:hypothetical protein